MNMTAVSSSWSESRAQGPEVFAKAVEDVRSGKVADHRPSPETPLPTTRAGDMVQRSMLGVLFL